MKAPTLSRTRLGRATLARQLLLAREELDPVEAVERLCGLQAQQPKPPFIGLWSRLTGYRREDLHAALHDRTAVRATFLRGTLHLVSAGDYNGLRAALGPVMDDAMRAVRSRAAGLDLAAVLPVARDLVQQRPRDFNELRALLRDEFPEVNERALGYAVRLHLPLVMVPTRDRWGYPSTAKFTTAEDWLGTPLATEEDPRPLIRRYLAAFGPATAADVQTWSGLKGLKPVLDGMREELSLFRDDRGRDVYDLPDAPRPDAGTPAPPRFLPEFDNLVLAHADRGRILADEHRAEVVTKNLRVKATFLHNGSVAGTWEVTRAKRTATLRLRPFTALPARALRHLREEGEALLRFAEEDAASFEVVQA
jgi:hypothetical protein